LITHNSKRPHSKAEEPDPARAGFLPNLFFIKITAQSSRGERRVRGTFCGCHRKTDAYSRLPKKDIGIQKNKKTPFGREVSVI
jgi:hypothetical protein